MDNREEKVLKCGRYLAECIEKFFKKNGTLTGNEMMETLGMFCTYMFTLIADGNHEDRLQLSRLFAKYIVNCSKSKIGINEEKRNFDA